MFLNGDITFLAWLVLSGGANRAQALPRGTRVFEVVAGFLQTAAGVLVASYFTTLLSLGSA
jgi:hypothetical protein